MIGCAERAPPDAEYATPQRHMRHRVEDDGDEPLRWLPLAKGCYDDPSRRHGRGCLAVHGWCAACSVVWRHAAEAVPWSTLASFLAGV